MMPQEPDPADAEAGGDQAADPQQAFRLADDGEEGALHGLRKQRIKRALEHQHQGHGGPEVAQAARRHCGFAALCCPKYWKNSLFGESTMVVSGPSAVR